MSLENGQAFLQFDRYLYVRERVLGLILILICIFCQFIEIFLLYKNFNCPMKTYPFLSNSDTNTVLIVQ